MKQRKGIVGVERVKGWLRLRLPRGYSSFKRYYNLGLTDNDSNYREALRIALEVEKQLKEGTFSGFSQANTKGEYIYNLSQLWGHYCEFKKNLVAETTYRQEYIGRCKKVIKGLPSQDLRASQEIFNYIVSNYTQNSASRSICILKALSKWAYENSYLPKDYFSGWGVIKKVRIKVSDPLSSEELLILLEAFKSHHKHKYFYPFIYFLAHTGCRPSEAIALTWSDIQGGVIKIDKSYSSNLGVLKDTKNHTTRYFPINSLLNTFITNITPPFSINNNNKKNNIINNLVFPGRNGGYMRYNYICSNVWKGKKGDKSEGIMTQLVNAGEIARYRTLYSLRHTFITTLVNKGVPPAQIAYWVGNSVDTIMKHYVGLQGKWEVPDILE